MFEQLILPLRFVYKVEAADASVNPMHHLDLKHGVYRLRVTVFAGTKLVGKRVYISLRTHNLILAQARRDRILSAMEDRGMLSLGKLRIQRRTGESEEATTSSSGCGRTPR